MFIRRNLSIFSYMENMAIVPWQMYPIGTGILFDRKLVAFVQVDKEMKLGALNKIALYIKKVIA